MKIPVYLPLLALLGIVYGSLMPFELRPRTYEQALQIFQNLPYLDLGIQSRADWVANILFYLPLGGLLYAWFTSRLSSFWLRTGLGVLVLAVGAGVAVGVEFLQIFFEPRTVSQNDILAELIGLVLGICFWEIFKGTLLPLFDSIRSKGRQALQAGLILYAFAYFFFNLFPFDFLVSVKELAWKWNSDQVYLLTISPKCGLDFRCLLVKAAEVVAVMPFGVYLLVRRREQMWTGSVRPFLLGVFLGLVLEGLQLFLASGVTHILSVLTRGLGVLLGAWSWAVIRGLAAKPEHLTGASAKGGVFFLLLFYIAALIKIYEWLDKEWQSWAEGWSQLSGKMFIPFFYHYYTTETDAVMSILANAAIYAPMGVLVFLLGASPNKWRSRGGTAAFMALITAAVLESGLLFLPAKHPDYTNVLIAALSASFAAAVCRWFFSFAGSFASA